MAIHRSDRRLISGDNGPNNWWIEHLFLTVPAQYYVAEQLASFAEFPPRQEPAKFNMDDILNNLKKTKSAD